MSDGIRVDLAELLRLERAAKLLANAPGRRSRDEQTGQRSSPFRGRGMEYVESRSYSAGDDVRHIDWRVSARSGRMHTKLFEAERERSTAVLFDHSELMRFGTRVCFKSVQAARLAALLLWLAASEGDRLSVASIGRAGAMVPPTGGRRGLLRCLQALVEWQGLVLPEPEVAPLAKALERMARVLRSGSHVMLALDPRRVDAGTVAPLARLRAHSDVVVALLVDPLELRLPLPGRYLVSDGHARRALALGDPAVRQAWTVHFQQRLADAHGLLKRAGIVSRVIACDENPVRALHELLHGCARREAA